MGRANPLASELQARTDQLRLAHARLLEQLRERERIEEQLLATGRMEAIARLAGGIAHDFKNLLTVIRLQLHVLRSGLGDRPAALSSIDEIDSAIDFAAALTGKLLAYGRRDMLRSERAEVAAVVREMEPLLARLCGDAITIELRIASGPVEVRLDAIGLEQVLLNLAINARDAMPAGGFLLISVERRTLDNATARTIRGGHAGDFVVLAVRDNGAGMDEQTQQRIFDPFFSTKSVDHGTGLGLATTQATVSQAGGFIDVHSSLGHGSEFVIYLPRVSGERPATAPPMETILLVDDEEGLRVSLADRLEEEGYRVITADSGAAALEAVHRHRGRIDLLIADVAMPGMTGFTLASQVRALIPRCSVIFVSGYVDSDQLDEPARFVKKPFEPETLLHEIRETLDEAADALDAEDTAVDRA